MHEKKIHPGQSYQLLDHGLDEGGEGDGLVGGHLLVVQEERKLRDTLRVRLRLEFVALLLEQRLNVLVVGDDAVVDNGKLVAAVRTVGVSVDGRGDAVGGPARVRHANVGGEGPLHVDLLLLGDELAQGDDLADLLKQENLGTVILVAIDSDTGRVIPAVLQPGKPAQQHLDDLRALLVCEVVEVRKDSTHLVVSGSPLWLSPAVVAWLCCLFRQIDQIGRGQQTNQ